MITFKDISLLHQLAPETFKELTLTAWDPENKCSIYFDKEKTPDIPICYAARVSMSFPVGFKPVRMDLGDGHGKRNLIDGGVGTNLPTEVFIHPPTTNADSNASNSDSIHDDSLSAAKSLIFTFDMQGNAYRVMYQANFTTPESKQAEQDARTAKKNPLITRVLTWFLGKDPFETDTNDSEKIWNAGPNALPVFHDTIGTMNVKISDTSAHAARLQAATEALEQIRARENQAYYSDFNSLDELVRNLSNDEKQAILKYVAARPKDSLNSATATDTALNRVDIAREKKSPAKKRASQARTRADSATEATTYIDIFGKAKNVKEKAEKAEKKVKFATASVTRALKSVDAAEKNANKEQELLQKIADILEPQSPQ